MNLDEIPKYVINIPERTERLDSVKKEIDNFFVNKDFHLINGELGKPANKFIAQAHQKCIQHAKDNDYENILIMEDDTTFPSKRSRSYADEAFKNLPPNWDILLGCIYYADRLLTIRDNKYWKKINSDFSSLSFYVVNKKSFDKILAFKLNMHIDRWCANQGRLNCFVVNEFFTIQKDNILSDNVGRIINYSNYLNSFKVLK